MSLSDFHKVIRSVNGEVVEPRMGGEAMFQRKKKRSARITIGRRPAVEALEPRTMLAADMSLGVHGAPVDDPAGEPALISTPLDDGHGRSGDLIAQGQDPRRSSITVIKDAVPNDPQDFEFRRSFGANF